MPTRHLYRRTNNIEREGRDLCSGLSYYIDTRMEDEVEYECPSCGVVLLKCQDNHGITYQCMAMDCLQCYDASEIEEG